MAVRAIVESLDDIPEALRPEYVEQDGKYVLQLEGGFTQADRDRLQRALAKERDDHKGTREKLRKYGDATPERFEELNNENEDLKLQLDTLKTQDDEDRTKKIEELAERRALARIKPLERKMQALQEDFQAVSGERDNLKQEKHRSRIVNAVTNSSLLKEVGVVPDAVEDVELWALSNFDTDDEGNVVSKDTLGTPGLSPKDVFMDMKNAGQRRHWFGTTTGAGASGGSGKESFADNPFTGGRNHPKFNLTKIASLCRRDPRLAVRMAKAASTKDYDATQHLPEELKKKL